MKHLHRIKTRPALVYWGLAAVFVSLMLPGPAPASTFHPFPVKLKPLSSSPNSHAAKLRKRPAHRPAHPALVTDLRIKHYPERVRIVFDLQRSVKFSQTRKKRPDRVIVELQDTKLTQTVQHKVESSALPGDLTIIQSKPQAVTVSLYLDKISDFKLVPLKEPDRLVLEVYYPTDDRQDPVGSEARAATAVSPRLDSPTPTPPVAPSSATEPVPGPPAVAPPPQIKALRRPVRDDIKTIVIDPGHGGKNPGAVGRDKVLEKHITLKVGMKLRDLVTSRLGRKVLMTRERDVFVELEDRTKFANHHDADLFVSIHVNSHPQRATRGLEIYHFGKASDRRALEVAARENGTPIESTGIGWQYLVADLLTDKKIQDSLELAWTARQAMVTHLNGYYDVVDLGVKTAPFYVLRFTTMPSILAEIGFVSNPTEERLMQGDAFLTRMAEAIFDGLKAFITPLQTAGVGGRG